MRKRVTVALTCQHGAPGGDGHRRHHPRRRQAVPQHAHANAEREERQAALEDHVHGQAEPTQRPEREGGLQRGEDAHRGELLQGQTAALPTTGGGASLLTLI